MLFEAVSHSAHSKLQESGAQLSMNLARANETVTSVSSERDALRNAVQEHKAEEERLM